MISESQFQREVCKHIKFLVECIEMQSFGYSFTENFFLLENEEIHQILVSSNFIVYKKFVWKLMDLFVDNRLGEETECLVDNWGEINFEGDFFF